MRLFAPHNSSKTNVCATGWRTRACVNMTSVNIVLYWQQNFRLPKNSTQWLDSLRLNVPGARLLDSLTTARRRLRVKKVSQNSRNTAARLSIKPVVGSFQLLERLSLFGMVKT